MGVAVLRSEDGSEPGHDGRPYIFRSNLARFDITVDTSAWGLGDDILDGGLLYRGLGLRIH